MSRTNLTVALLLPLLVLAACKDDEQGIQRDENGCWTSGHQAWEALYVERQCASTCGNIAEGMEQECMEEMREAEEDNRDILCFDGCTVDACIDALDQFLDTCSEDDGNAAIRQCFYGDEAVFWNYNSVRSYSDECIGW